MRRARAVTFAAVLALAVCAAVAVAQQPAPTVAVTTGPGSVAVQASAPLAAGPTHFHVTRQGNKDVSVYFILLNAGVTLPEFQATLASDDKTGGESAIGMVWVQASVPLSGSQSERGVTFSLRPGQTYVVMSEVEAESNGRVLQRGFTTFTTSGASNGATAAAPDATVRMQGLRFRGASTLPRNGVVRVVNQDAVPHIAIAFPLRKGVTSKKLGRALLSDNERAIGRLLAGQPYDLQSGISGGNTANDQEAKFAKPGKYGLVCFFDSHERLGMYRVITVK